MTKEQHRDLTITELDFLKVGQMPCGHGNQIEVLARGGASMNIKCAHCELKLNVLEGHYFWGQLLHAPKEYHELHTQREARIKAHAAAKDKAEFEERKARTSWYRVLGRWLKPGRSLN